MRTHRTILAGALIVTGLGAVAAQAPKKGTAVAMVVYKSPT
jgi:hypothetical protein